MNKILIERLKNQLSMPRLTINCYRIRRRFSLPLPLTQLPILDIQVRGFSQSYPWQIWCLWALEERLYVLNGAASLSDAHEAREARMRCVEDLEALAKWPRYTIVNKLDLPFGHAVQLLATALRDWTWLPEKTQRVLRAALQRAVEEGMPLVPAEVRTLTSANAFLAKSMPHQHLHNIPLIAQAALASAAEVIKHPERKQLSSRFFCLFQARLALYHEGLTEGISYDGYLYNFALAWLSTQNRTIKEAVIHHPAMNDLEQQARGLACPGQIWQSAEIGDVEPLEMPFVWSALSRLQQWDFSPSREALLDAVLPDRLRAEALWIRAQTIPAQNDITGDVVYKNGLDVLAVQKNTAAITLASGLAEEDLSVVMSLCRSPMNHIQADNGTLLIGHVGHWWITDPGYQQYLKTSERDFTLGSVAHNTPIVNGYGQTNKVGKLLLTGSHKVNNESASAYAVIDITACYPIEAKVQTVTRTLWRIGRDQVVVCDTVKANLESSVAYHWHGNADAYWGEQAGAISLNQASSHRTFWIQSGQQSLSLAQQHRLRGSRGQCTLQVLQPPSVTHHWWVFSFSDNPVELQASDTQARIEDIYLDLAELLPKEPSLPSLYIAVHNSHIRAAIRYGDELLGFSRDIVWQLELSINGKVDHKLTSSDGQWLLPIPAINSEDTVILLAKPTHSDQVIERPLTFAELKSIYSILLRVYAKIVDNQITGRCLIMPEAIEGEVEYAFYLLVDGQKTQVRWYEASATHTFTLTAKEAGKNIQVRGFARSKSTPDKKLSAVSITLSIPLITEVTPTMSEHSDSSTMDSFISELKKVEQALLKANKSNTDKTTRDLITVQNRLYAQLESLTWLQRRLAIKGQLPPLRGWATSPDVLLRLHSHIMTTRPSVIVECGSGASTLVIADALQQNGMGKLISLEHSEFYGSQTLATLQAENLEAWVDLRIGELEPWQGEHLNPDDAEKPSFWYPASLLESVENVDLLWVDGPPGATCLFSRYPALPALAEKLTSHAQVWMDDTIRQEEKDICEHWAENYGFDLEYFPLEKGLGRLTRSGSKLLAPAVATYDISLEQNSVDQSEKALGLNFSIPDQHQG